MSMNDPIADMLTRIRNGVTAHHQKVQIPLSNVKRNLANILLEEGYISGYTVISEEPKGILELTLKYGPKGEKVLRGINRISKPGRRVYESADDMRKVRDGIGMAIVSTSQGLMTDRDARRKHVGGEILCEVY